MTEVAIVLALIALAGVGFLVDVSINKLIDVEEKRADIEDWIQHELEQFNSFLEGLKEAEDVSENDEDQEV